MRSLLLALLALLCAAPPASAGDAAPLSAEDFARLAEALRTESGRPLKVRLQAAVILGRSGGVEALSPLAECLSDDEEYPVRAACAMALGNIGDVHAVEPLVARLEDPEELVRSTAREALFKLAAPEAVPYLQVARERGSARVRLVLVELAARIADPSAGLLLTELIGDGDEKVREQAAAALKAMDPATVDALLLRALDHPSYRVKAHAARLVGQRKRVEAVDRLVELASSPLEAVEVQAAARGALAELRPVLDVARLATAARDGALLRKERQRALVLLSALAGAEALGACVEALRDDDLSIRGAAAQALAEMGDASALSAIREAAERTPDERIKRAMLNSVRRLERARR